jgi:hypothetical protein
MIRGYEFHKIKVVETRSKILVCPCGIKFIEIQPEIDMGYTRHKCPWCEPYKHTGHNPPPITHTYYPVNFNKKW